MRLFGWDATDVYTSTALLASTASGASPDRITFTFPPGKQPRVLPLCAATRGGTGAANYRLSYSEANDNIPAAPVTLGARTNGWVNTSFGAEVNDPHDVYSFTAVAGTTIRARLFKTDAAYGGEADLQLFNAAGVDVFSTAGRVAAAETGKPSTAVDTSAKSK